MRSLRAEPDAMIYLRTHQPSTSGFALPAKPAEPGLRTAVSKHVDRKIPVALIAALIVPSLKPDLDFIGFFGNRFNKVVWLLAVAHSIESLAQQTIDGRHRVLAKIEFIEADHLDAKAFQHLLAFKVLRREIHPPRRRIYHPWRHAFREVKLKPIVFQDQLTLLSPGRNPNEEINAIIRMVIRRIKLLQVFSELKLGDDFAIAVEIADQRNLTEPMQHLSLHRRRVIQILFCRHGFGAFKLTTIVK